MRQAVYNDFRNAVYDATGINLGPRKQALVAARVSKRMRVLGLSEYDEYLRRVTADESGAEMTQMIDAICTNVTSFFREREHFQFVRDVVLERKAAGQRQFKIWSAACSSGEEPYSIAMTLADLAASEECDIQILATDLSTKALRAAMRGEYPPPKLADVDTSVVEKYFRVAGTPEEPLYEVCPSIRHMVVFRQLNLSRPPFAIRGPLDIVFCRNVMIYFDKPVRDGLLEEVQRVLRPGGHLMVGHAETLSGTRGFKALQPSVYERR